RLLHGVAPGGFGGRAVSLGDQGDELAVGGQRGFVELQLVGAVAGDEAGEVAQVEFVEHADDEGQGDVAGHAHQLVVKLGGGGGERRPVGQVGGLVVEVGGELGQVGVGADAGQQVDQRRLDDQARVEQLLQ